MAPRPFDTWPGYIKNSFRSHINTPITWPAVMEDCIRNGIKDANFITDVVFYLHVWESHGWGPATGHPKMEALWTYFNGIIKKRLRMNSKDFDEKPVMVDYKKWRIRYLKDVDVTEVADTWDKQDRLSSLRFLILAGLEGRNPRQNFDWYEYSWKTDSVGSGYQPARDNMSNVQNLKRGIKKNALDSFNTMANRAVPEGSKMGTILNTIESAMYTNTNAFKMWLIAKGKMGDASAEKYEEVKWLEQTIELGKNNYHVYSIYVKFLRETLKNARN